MSLQRAYVLNKMDEKGLSEIMNKAGKICAAFFAEKNLEKMLDTVAKTEV